MLTDPDRLTALLVLGIRDRNSFPLIFFGRTAPTWRSARLQARTAGPELQSFLAMLQRPHRLRDAAELEHLHWATTRRGTHEELMVLAIDHRLQFEEMARATGAEHGADRSVQGIGAARGRVGGRGG